VALQANKRVKKVGDTAILVESGSATRFASDGLQYVGSWFSCQRSGEAASWR
jgi:hypothetical protein